ncbi:hypothetical protein HDV63DRAFT_157728 [Trichoderma sp. SZMC 28014]
MVNLLSQTALSSVYIQLIFGHLLSFLRLFVYASVSESVAKPTLQMPKEGYAELYDHCIYVASQTSISYDKNSFHYMYTAPDTTEREY